MALWLRAQRQGAGLTYEQLAERTDPSADTLARAASGRSVPKLRVVMAFAKGCEADCKKAESLWVRARYAEARASEKRMPVLIPYVSDFASLHSAMLDLHRRDGARPYAVIESRIPNGKLPHTTLWRILQRNAVPTREQVLDFAQAFDVQGGELEEWGRAWDRADRERRLPSGAGGLSRSEQSSRPPVEDQHVVQDDLAVKDEPAVEDKHGVKDERRAQLRAKRAEARLRGLYASHERLARLLAQVHPDETCLRKRYADAKERVRVELRQQRAKAIRTK
ncbi:helix-turn-helix domain-containing protein [Streptomyces ovatisporus]|uniref:Helix-turn-helix domain-containing protein n=1 Tax=Streptomyces ovatisporus TaxID=1128682 RepID=A0ABV9A8F3_9ACTN